MKKLKPRGNFKINWRLKTRKICEIEKCISLKEFAKINNVSISTVYYWLATRKVIGYKIKTNWFIKVCDS